MLHFGTNAIRGLAAFLALAEFAMPVRYYVKGEPIGDVTTVLGKSPSAAEIQAFFAFTSVVGLVRAVFAAQPRNRWLSRVNMLVHLIEAPTIVGLMLAYKALPTSVDQLGSDANARMSAITAVAVTVFAVAFRNWHTDLESGKHDEVKRATS